MRIILPPSERKGLSRLITKTDFNLESIFAGNILKDARLAVREELFEILTDSTQNPGKILKVPPRMEDQMYRNLVMDEYDPDWAAQIFSGVLYEYANLLDFKPEVISEVMIFSALYGAVLATDYVLPHRLAMKANFPKLGRLASFWRTHIAYPLSQWTDGHLLIDLRSQEYKAAWNPLDYLEIMVAEGSIKDQHILAPTAIVQVDARTVNPDGTLKVVTHNAKAARGCLINALIGRSQPINNAQELLSFLRRRGGNIERVDAAVLGCVEPLKNKYLEIPQYQLLLIANPGKFSLSIPELCEDLPFSQTLFVEPL